MPDATPVLIVGGGPVGLTLAIELGRRDVACLLIEAKDAPQFLPKMERCNARTMEIFRRMGLAEEIRAASFPEKARMDVAVVTRLADPALVRLTYPSVAEATEAGRECSDATLPLEPYQVVSQYTLEPLLKRHAESLSSVTVRFGVELVDFVQDADGVIARVRTSAGEEERIRADFVVGCDGGRSTVRKGLGIALAGDGGIARRNQVFFHSKDLLDKCADEQCRMYFFANQDQSILTVQDDVQHFSFHTNCFGTEAEVRAVMDDAFGFGVDYEIIAATPWTLHLLAAEKLQVDRVFLAGDAVRLIIPSGGLGLNTGIGDAVDLGWKLAAVVHGWGGSGLLAAYERERLPTTMRSLGGSRHANQGQLSWRALVRENIADDTPEGRGVRRSVAYVAGIMQRRTHEMVGIELGYRYEDSPIVCAEDGPWPPDVPEVYVPTARPGARLPHRWLSDDSALHDHLGMWFTVVALAPGMDDDAEAIRAALADIDVPVEVLALDEPALVDQYGATLLVIRPDLHVAWRGNTASDSPADMCAQISGRRT